MLIYNFYLRMYLYIYIYVCHIQVQCLFMCILYISVYTFRVIMADDGLR